LEYRNRASSISSGGEIGTITSSGVGAGAITSSGGGVGSTNGGFIGGFFLKDSSGLLTKLPEIQLWHHQIALYQYNRDPGIDEIL